MPEVNNVTFYHIQSLYQNIEPWKIGKTYDIGAQKNNYLAFYDQCNFSNPNNNANVLEFIKNMHEYFFEKVRLEKFSSKPSRNNCVWLIPDSKNLTNALTFWLNQLLSGRQIMPFRTIKLKCSGCAHYANQSFLRNYPQNISEIRIDAEKYWGSVDALPESNNTEVIFTGTVTVESVIDPFCLEQI